MSCGVRLPVRTAGVIFRRRDGASAARQAPTREEDPLCAGTQYFGTSAGGLVQRTGRTPGRGGCTYSAFKPSECDGARVYEAGVVDRDEVFARLKRCSELADSPCHGFNFSCGVAAGRAGASSPAAAAVAPPGVSSRVTQAWAYPFGYINALIQAAAHAARPGGEGVTPCACC